MGNSRTNEGFVTQKVKQALFIASPADDADAIKLRRKKNIEDAIVVGFKSMAIYGGSVAVLLFVGARKVPWVKANINYAGRTYIITSACVATLAFTGERHLEKCVEEDRLERIRALKSE